MSTLEGVGFLLINTTGSSGGWFPLPAGHAFSSWGISKGMASRKTEQLDCAVVLGFIKLLKDWSRDSTCLIVEVWSPGSKEPNEDRILASKFSEASASRSVLRMLMVDQMLEMES